jgi:hypothetical protein
MKFEFNYKGIWYIVYIFILLDSKNKDKYLLLGLSWFYSICIIFNILASIIQIGDPDINKKTILIQEFKLKESIFYNLILYPMVIQYKYIIKLAETLINR